MKKDLPPLALVWVYQGGDVAARLKTVSAFDYPNFEIVDVGEGQSWLKALDAIPASAEMCVLWLDDGKHVSRNFLREMILPLTASPASGPALHFWSGNALSIPTRMIERSGLPDYIGSPSLLSLLLPLLERAGKEPGERVHLIFSSTERLSPMSMDPVGLPS